MKLKLSTTLALTITLSVQLSYSQTLGTVNGYTKISDTQGNFTGTLLDNDYWSNCYHIGDINNDGIEDMAVGQITCADGGYNHGCVWILFMNANGTVNSHQKISSTQGNFTGTLLNDDRFGTSVTGLGDLNNDGVNDIAVGAYYDSESSTHTGAVWILFLNSNGTVNSHQKISETQGGIVGLTANRFFGASVAGLGDLDGDGNEDIAVGSPQYDNDGGTYRGCVWILFLNSNGTVSAQQKINDYNGNFGVTLDNSDYFGYGLANIGDIDDDGVNDISACARWDDDGGVDRGAIYIIMMNTDGTAKNVQKISDTQGGFMGTLQDGDRFGQFTAGLGDVDGDSIPDIAVSQFFDDGGGFERGAIHILYLNNDGTVKAEQKISDTQGGFTGVLSDSDRFGLGLTSMGDLNSDGVLDLAVGAQQDDDGGANRGAVYILNVEADITGFEEHADEALSIYPNPTMDIVHVETPGPFTYQLLDMNGKLVIEGEGMDQCEFSTRALAIGAYQLRITTEQLVMKRRIIKK